MDPASDYEEEDPEGEDLLENAAADYQRIEGLDRYDAANLDNRAYGEMTLDQRRAAEEENARRVARNQGIEELLGDAGEEDDEDKRGRRARFGPKVKAKGEQRRASSDFMEMEQERGISISSTVLSYEYGGARRQLRCSGPAHSLKSLSARVSPRLQASL